MVGMLGPAQKAFAQKNGKALHLAIAGFPDRGSMPRRFTCDGENVSPPLTWSGEPEGTRSFALMVEDRDTSTGFVHWILWDIPVSVHSLTEGAAEGVSGTNDFGKRGYGGPCPPARVHHYAFLLFALDLPSLSVPAGAKRPAVDKAMRKHVLAKVEYEGDYGHD
jgi:Raf kinase inhibitor-like YbhB/YbcL family protein